MVRVVTLTRQGRGIRGVKEMFLGLGCGSSCGQNQTWCGIICMPNGKKCKSLPLKLESVVEFRACFLHGRSLAYRFAVVQSQRAFLLMLPSASITRENISLQCGTSTYPFTFSKRKKHASKTSPLLTPVIFARALVTVLYEAASWVLFLEGNPQCR